MKIKVFRTVGGWWAVMVWDPVKNDYFLWWSGSKKTEDMKRVVCNLLEYRKEVTA